MKHFLLALFLFPVWLQAQNLVPNSNFEEYTSCPQALDEVKLLKYWSVYRSTPDYFNRCSSSFDCSVPSNSSGYQEPFILTDNAYCGLITYLDFELYREYLGCQLLSPLIIGQKYFVSMKVSLANLTTDASNNIGMQFSTISYSDTTGNLSPNPAPINNRAQVYSQNIISDTNWVNVSGSFIADSAYSYLIIGNFFNDSITNHIRLGSLYGDAYYYIDDICVSSDSEECDVSNGINNYRFNEIVNVYPNPTSDLLNINLFSDTHSLIIYNVLGQEIYIENWRKNKASINVSSFPNGIYFLQIKTGGNILYKQFIIQK